MHFWVKGVQVMSQKHTYKYRAIAAVAAAAIAVPAMTMPAFAGNIVCTIQGEQIPVASNTVQTVKVEQSTMVDMQLQTPSEADVFVSNPGVASVTVPQPYKDGAAEYALYAYGKVGSSTEVYANDGTNTKLCTIEVLDRPFVSDTTMNCLVEVGKSYTFRITPNNPDDYVTFCTTDGSAFSTSVVGKSVENGKTNYYFRMTALKSGGAGVYVTVGDKQYRVFAIDTVDHSGNGNSDTSQNSNSNSDSTPTSTGKTGTVQVSGSLNIRSGAGTNYGIVGTLKNGDKVTIITDAANGWTQIQTSAGVRGYCSADYIKVTNSGETNGSSNGNASTNNTQTATVKVSGSLNIRSGPGTNYAVAGTLKQGDKVTVLGNPANGWAQIQTSAGIKGYCSTEYLDIQGASNNNNGSTIALNVPKYMQTDSAWGNEWIGGEGGGTIRSIGCTLTCVAMSESYRTGDSLTPDIMATKLQFTSEGLMYWPDGYATVSGLTDTNLTALYQKLKADTPVIVGGANSQTTHYAIVTGCKNVPLDSNGNPTSLNASMFTVNDPGYSNVTTLQDFITKFPSGRSYRSY